ncbi:MAG TPA: UDP-N-acetylglucosamine--N-acetylmuramyl-(pentapeptide) pyrophosphoryl-undecaprenol N-acetylglucosamine transferase [Pirellulales bacterium]|nr:UDP-N-acetylglucosamine--N-acetylmuramyl-(pentapeptide) pyrophosphoryl-undecaprenol N-acetylglucosamine transferase [Pirellulales bacterium]
MSQSSVHIMFAGGGTGGHLFPGLAVAEQLRLAHPELRIAFAGSGKPWECEEVARLGHEYVMTPARPWLGPRWSAGKFVLDNALGYCAALRYLRRRRVATVIGLGGYASAPAARAAATCGIPLVLLEQNALPGKVNRWLAPYASLICAAFAESRSFLRSGGAFHLTGNPIRCVNPTTAPLTERNKQIVVVGGSRGSKMLNQNAAPAIAKTKLPAIGWEILHVAGEEGVAETQALYRSHGMTAAVRPFVDDLPKTISRARLVICRAGGSTLAELAAAGTPAVVCPFPQAADDHQRRNAASFAAAGACLVVDEQQPGGAFCEQLAGAVNLLANDLEQWSRCSAAMATLARPHAARDIAELILERLKGRRCAG